MTNKGVEDVGVQVSDHETAQIWQTRDIRVLDKSHSRGSKIFEQPEKTGRHIDFAIRVRLCFVFPTGITTV